MTNLSFLTSQCVVLDLKTHQSATITTCTRGPCNSRILGEMKIRELQNREFQGPQYLGLNVP